MALGVIIVILSPANRNPLRWQPEQHGRLVEWLRHKTFNLVTWVRSPYRSSHNLSICKFLPFAKTQAKTPRMVTEATWMDFRRSVLPSLIEGANPSPSFGAKDSAYIQNHNTKMQIVMGLYFPPVRVV